MLGNHFCDWECSHQVTVRVLMKHQNPKERLQSGSVLTFSSNKLELDRRRLTYPRLKFVFPRKL